jgi:hypothetical protein
MAFDRVFHRFHTWTLRHVALPAVLADDPKQATLDLRRTKREVKEFAGEHGWVFRSASSEVVSTRRLAGAAQAGGQVEEGVAEEGEGRRVDPDEGLDGSLGRGRISLAQGQQ